MYIYPYFFCFLLSLLHLSLFPQFHCFHFSTNPFINHSLCSSNFELLSDFRRIFRGWLQHKFFGLAWNFTAFILGYAVVTVLSCFCTSYTMYCCHRNKTINIWKSRIYWLLFLVNIKEKIDLNKFPNIKEEIKKIYCIFSCFRFTGSNFTNGHWSFVQNSKLVLKEFSNLVGQCLVGIKI